MKVLTAIITMSKFCCSGIRRLTINHVQLIEGKSQTKEAFKIREVSKFWSHINYTNEVYLEVMCVPFIGGRTLTTTIKNVQQVKYRHYEISFHKH